MALTRRRAVAAMVVAGALAVLLAYLRDPPWLIEVSSGFGAWRTDRAGVRYRPMAGRASFFVPADAASVTVAVRAPITSPSDWPVTATFFVDDRAVDRLVLTDARWRAVTIESRRESRRRVRRIDIHADRTRGWNHGLDVGAVEVSGR